MPGAQCTRKWGNGLPGGLPSKPRWLRRYWWRASRGLLGRQAVVPHIDGVTKSRTGLAPSIEEETTMSIMQEIDVSLECSSVCVVDTSGKIVEKSKWRANQRR